MTTAPVPDGRSGSASDEKAAARVAALFERHGRMVYGVCRAMLRNVHDAEDATQQTFLAAHRALLAGARVREEGPWLATIARNECRHRIAAGMRTPPALADEDLESLPATHDEIERRARSEALRAAIAELPERQREAVVLRDLYGLRYREVATALGLSRPATEALLFRARRSLRVKLRPVVGVALAVPVAIRDDLAEAIPGFGTSTGPGVVVAGTAGGVLAKLTAGPLGFKVATAAVAVSAVGAVGSVGPDPAVRDRSDRTPIADSVDAGSPVLVDASTLEVNRRVPGDSSRSLRSGGHDEGLQAGDRHQSGHSGEAHGSGAASHGSGRGGTDPSSTGSGGADEGSGGDAGPGGEIDTSRDGGGTRNEGPGPIGTSGPTGSDDDGGRRGDTGATGSGSSGPGPGAAPGSSGSDDSAAPLDDRSRDGSPDGEGSVSGSSGSGPGSGTSGSSGGSEAPGGGSDSASSGSGTSDGGSGSGGH